MKKSAPWLLIGGGAAAIAAALAAKKYREQTSVIENALAGKDEDGKPLPAGARPSFKVHATGYWPYVANLSAKERLMEGGTKDRKGNPIYTLEMHQADPVSYPYVSVAGDYTIFPYGQKLIVSAWPKATFRVVDTGGHFFGANKVYRVIGEEPLDFAVDSSKTFVPKSGVTAEIVPGDNFEKGAPAVATGKIKSQTISGEVAADDHDALARALASELAGRTRDEIRAAAWCMRNLAKERGVSLGALLAPRGEYGIPAQTGGYASTRRVSNEMTRNVAYEIISAKDSDDPTRGAVDFWVPEQQAKMRELGDVHRAALSAGDPKKALKFSRFAGYGTEDEVRQEYARLGLRPAGAVGALELVGKVS